MHTHILATSYGGQLREIMFTSNTDPNPALKDNCESLRESKIDKVILLRRLRRDGLESVRLEE